MTFAPVRAGVDLVDVARLERMLADSSPGFLASAWTKAEQADSELRPDRLAARWAAKEAAMKALGVGIGTLSPTDIEVRIDEFGAPELLLHGSARARSEDLNLKHWSLSLSHEGGLAIAFVVALAGGNHD